MNGVIYLHRISDPRIGGNTKRNLRMFRELCGESALKNVFIALTNCGRVTKEEGDRREREYRESPNSFKPLLDAGAQLVRHDTGATSAMSIVDALIRKNPTKLQIQIELDEGRTLEETGAGSVLKEEIKALAEKHKAEMQALQVEMEEATRGKEAELLAELELERQMMEQRTLKIQEDLRVLEMQTKGANEDRKAQKRALSGVAEAAATVCNTMEPAPKVQKQDAPKMRKLDTPKMQQRDAPQIQDTPQMQKLDTLQMKKQDRPKARKQDLPKMQQQGTSKMQTQSQTHAKENRDTQLVQETTTARKKEAQRRGQRRWEDGETQRRERRPRRVDVEVQRGVVDRFVHGFLDGFEKCLEIGHEHFGVLGAIAGGMVGLFVVGPFHGLDAVFL